MNSYELLENDIDSPGSCSFDFSLQIVIDIYLYILHGQKQDRWLRDPNKNVFRKNRQKC